MRKAWPGVRFYIVMAFVLEMGDHINANSQSSSRVALAFWVTFGKWLLVDAKLGRTSRKRGGGREQKTTQLIFIT